jgi:hypothetical protein
VRVKPPKGKIKLNRRRRIPMAIKANVDKLGIGFAGVIPEETIVDPSWKKTFHIADENDAIRKILKDLDEPIRYDELISIAKERNEKNMENYMPNPINTADVTVPAEIEELADKIAENVHEVWAKGRYEQGWRYGKERDDEKRLTPCMVPYNRLTEEEKAYDYNTAFETLKLIIKLGYEIKLKDMGIHSIKAIDGTDVDIDDIRVFADEATFRASLR